MDLTTCCHSFDITTDYSNGEFRIMHDGLKATYFAGRSLDFPGYFQTVNQSSLIEVAPGSALYSKGIDEVTKQTKIDYSVKKGFLYLTVNLNYQQFPYPSGLCGSFSPVNFYSRVYDIGFPLTIPSNSATFLQANYSSTSVSQSYFLFSPWYVNSMSSIDGVRYYSKYGTNLLVNQNGSAKNLPVKSWGNYVIYKQSPTDTRTPGKPNVLFANKNSVVTYAMQHKALFTQRCLYVLKFKEVKAGDFIGLKTSHNTQTGNNFNVVIWWSVDGEGKAPTNVTAKEFREVKATKDTTPEKLRPAAKWYVLILG